MRVKDRKCEKCKSLSDSLQAQIDKMSKEYNTASSAKKKELQDMLSARNQQVNNYRQANLRTMDELLRQARLKKMQTVYDKVNVYITAKHRTGGRGFERSSSQILQHCHYTAA